MIKEYIKYLRDNPKGYWFKRKLYGWGWVPVKQEGWTVLGVFILFISWNGINMALRPEPTSSETVWFFLRIVLAVLALILICYKTGEKPRWQWGIKNK